MFSQTLDRVLVDVGTNEERLLLVVVGIHGNEQGSLEAVKRVYQKIQAHQIPLRGKWVVLTGNLRAIRENQRFINKDLNRLWSDESLKISEPIWEVNEMEELKLKIEFYSKPAQTKFFADLHATSGEDGIFALLEKEMLSKIKVVDFFVPLILADSTMLQNTLLRYMTDQNFVSIAFEAGQIGSEQEKENHEIFIWKMLKFSGIIGQIPEMDESRLIAFSSKLPKLLGFDYAHKLTGNESFKMRSGFKNFSYVQKGEVLGYDIDGEVNAGQPGYLLMPLYQKSGYEGFFLISERNLDE